MASDIAAECGERRQGGERPGRHRHLSGFLRQPQALVRIGLGSGDVAEPAFDSCEEVQSEGQRVDLTPGSRRGHGPAQQLEDGLILAQEHRRRRRPDQQPRLLGCRPEGRRAAEVRRSVRGVASGEAGEASDETEHDLLVGRRTRLEPFAPLPELDDLLERSRQPGRLLGQGHELERQALVERVNRRGGIQQDPHRAGGRAALCLDDSTNALSLHAKPDVAGRDLGSGEERQGAFPLSTEMSGLGGVDQATRAIVGTGRELSGTLEGGRRRRVAAPGACSNCRLFQLRGGEVVGRDRSRSPMPWSPIGVLRDAERVGESDVGSPALCEGGALVGGRPNERMPEADPLLCDRDQAVHFGGLERVERRVERSRGLCHHVDSRLVVTRGDEQERSRRRLERSDPVDVRLLDRRQLGASGRRTGCQLEQRERVSSGVPENRFGDLGPQWLVRALAEQQASVLSGEWYER